MLNCSSRPRVRGLALGDGAGGGVEGGGANAGGAAEAVERFAEALHSVCALHSVLCNRVRAAGVGAVGVVLGELEEGVGGGAEEHRLIGLGRQRAREAFELVALAPVDVYR